VVDVVEMKESLYDRMLVTLTLLAPLLLFALSQWRASLDTWYAPLDAGHFGDFGEQFTQNVAAWLADSDETGSRLIVIVDRGCACTKAALRSVDAALAQSRRRDIQLTVRYVDDVDPRDDAAAWRAVIEELPATPSLLAVEGRRLVYAGPVNSGDLCTSAGQRVLGVTALQAPRARPILNWLDRGCYCRLNGSSNIERVAHRARGHGNLARHPSQPEQRASER
jgi:hypothetical protein